MTDAAGLELASGCGRYIYSVIPVFLQTPRHRISDDMRGEGGGGGVKERDGTRGKLNSICEQIDNSLILTSPPGVLCSPKQPQLFIDKLPTSASPAARSLPETPRNKPVSPARNRSPLKSMRPLGRLTKNKKLSKRVQHDDKNNKVSKKGVKKREERSREKTSPDSGPDIDTRLDDYFLSHSKRCVTSGNTLADLSQPKLTHQEVQRILSSSSHAHSTQQLQADMLHAHTLSFQAWRDLLALQMNILVFGLGSKRQLLDTFRRQHLCDSCHLVINGFFPSLSMKEILTQISADVLGCDTTFRTLSEHCNFIVSQFPRRDDLPSDLYLIIHNICGTGLQTELAQFTLSQLAACKRIHLVASIDLIKGCLLWDQGVLSKFRWVWQHCPTYAPYTEETSYENSFFIQQSGSVALSSLVHVMASLTPNACKIFRLLAQQYLESGSKKQSGSGTAFYDLYAKCRANFLVNSEQSLRAQLTEFIDHKLVRSRRGGDGVEYLKVAVDQSTLRIYFEEHFEL